MAQHSKSSAGPELSFVFLPDDADDKQVRTISQPVRLRARLVPKHPDPDGKPHHGGVAPAKHSMGVHAAADGRETSEDSKPDLAI